VKTSIEHLPEVKQKQIQEVVAIIREVVEPEKIILFGSYATGNWVEDKYMENGIMYEYRSDYDFLVVTKDNKEKEHLLSDKIINRSRHLFPEVVSPIIHDIGYVNEGLEIGQYFFSDIIKEGVLLYDTGEVEFLEAKLLTTGEQKERAGNYFQQHFISASEFLEGAKFYLEREQNKLAAFMLHQAAERFYNTILLVFTGYKPKTHSLEKLRQYSKLYSKPVFEIFPEPMKDQATRHLFELLKRGYIDARYKSDYMITTAEVQHLIGKLQNMKIVVEVECRIKMEL